MQVEQQLVNDGDWSVAGDEVCCAVLCRFAELLFVHGKLGMLARLGKEVCCAVLEQVGVGKDG